MKKLISLLLAAVSVVLITGCANVGKSLATTAVTVDSAMQGWATYVALGNATEEQEAQVKTAYAKYQASMRIARDAYVAAATAGNKDLYTSAAEVLEANQFALLSMLSFFQTAQTTPQVKVNQ